FAKSAVDAGAHVHTFRIGVGLRDVGRWLNVRMVTHLTRRILEHLHLKAALHRGVGIFAGTRAFERIAALLDHTFDVAGLAGGAAEVFEAVIIGFEFVVTDRPILNRHSFGNELLAVFFLVMAADSEFAGREPIVLAIPVHACAA